MTRFLALFCIFMSLSTQSFADAKFRQWIKDFYSVAAKQGISRQTYNKAFQGVREPDRSVIESAAYQPEFKTKIWDYLDSRVNPYSIRVGLEKKQEFGWALDALENYFGVDRHILLAIWSMETSYGAIFDKPEKLKNVPRALATLAYLGNKRRAKFGRTQLIAALKILQQGHIGPQGMYGSWAGAMGHTQFIPTSYLIYAIDADGDGRKDIWNSIPDALASAANLLVKNGWRSGRTWGYEVLPPRNAYNYNGQTKTLSQWAKLGFKRTHGRKFARGNERAELKMLAGANGPAFLMTRNFFIIKNYNNANSYALGVGLLADRLAGAGPMVQKWPRPKGSLNVDEKVELQRELARLGLYKGEFDGNIGSGSRAAIASFQKKYNLPIDEKPSQNLLKAAKRARR